MDQFWIWIIVIFGVALIIGLSANQKVGKIDEAFNESLKLKGIDISSKIDLGTYVGGHPGIDKTIENVFSFKHNNSLILYAKFYKESTPINTAYFVHIADIPISNIKNISLEDSSSIENKVTLGRIMLVGIFALAWKRKRKNEEAFVNINWQGGKYEHETLFRFENKAAFQDANTVRNKLIRQTE